MVALELPHFYSATTCRPGNGMPHDNGGDTNKVTSAPQTMQAQAYQEHSIHQYSAHVGCQDMLTRCMDRLSHRMQLEDVATTIESPRRRLWVDWGSADGSNSLQTLQRAMSALRDADPISTPPPVHIVFEEHPSSDQKLLEHTLETHKGWFDSRNATYSVLMGSFYEARLFPDNSVDFGMSYLCLHWLNTDSVTPLSLWKNLTFFRDAIMKEEESASIDPHKNDTTTATTTSLSDFVSVQERQVPPALTEAWRMQLAREHLAEFWEHRSRELRPGAEMVVMMVSAPHEFIQPFSSFSDETMTASPLTIALQRCISQGSVRRTVLEQAVIPAYFRQANDIEEALALSQDRGALLELVELKSYETWTDVDTSDDLEGACGLYWSIHGSMVQTAGATREEQIAVRRCLMDIFEDLYKGKGGFRGTFLACVVRRRTRPVWSRTYEKSNSTATTPSATI